MKNTNRTRKPAMRFFALIIAIAMVMCMFAGCAKKDSDLSPIEYLKKAITTSKDTAADKLKTEPVDEDLRGSIAVSANLSEIEAISEQLGDVDGLDISLSAKLYLDYVAKAFGLDVKANGLGMNIIDGFLFLDNDKLALSTSGIIGNHSYGIPFENLAEKFDSSIFGPDGVYSIDITSAEIEKVIEAMTEEYELQEKYLEDISGILEDCSDVLYKSVEENGKLSKEDGSLKIDGKSIDTVDVVVVLDYLAAISVAEDVLEWVKDSEEIEELLQSALETASMYAGDAFDADMLDEIYDEIDYMLEELELMKEEADDVEGELKLTFSILEDRNQLIGFAFETIDAGNNDSASLVIGPSYDDIDYFAACVQIYGMKYEVIGNINTLDNDKEYSGEIVIDLIEGVGSYSDEMTVAIGVRHNKETGDAVAYLEADDEIIISLEATITENEDVITVAPGLVILGGGDPVDLTGIYIGIDSNDPIPEPEAFTDILTMTEDDVMELFESILELAELFG